MSLSVVSKKRELTREEFETQQQVREARGARLFENGNVCMTEGSFFVQSENHADTIYEVQGGKCECPDFQRRQVACKHVFAVEFYFLANGVNQ